MSARSAWSPHSWRALPILQQPVYADARALNEAIGSIASLPPLVSAREVDALRAQLLEVARGERFVLQGGDCAERFLDCNARAIESKLRILLQMSLVLAAGARTPTLQIARMGGQYAKPRSKETEVLDDGCEVPSFRGDNINGFAIDDRAPDPRRLLLAYFHSAATLNHVRTLLRADFASLDGVCQWPVDFGDTPAAAMRRAEYESLIVTATHSLRALDQREISGCRCCHCLNNSASATPLPNASISTSMSASTSTPLHLESSSSSAASSLAPTDCPQTRTLTDTVFMSHEGLILEYETALTRLDVDSNKFYNLGAHFLWIGERTRQLDGAHIEYFRGIANPIGLKVGPSVTGDELVRVCRVLNPSNEVGKLCLITRLGADCVRRLLPPLIAAVRDASLEVIWICDPMHGNTHSARVDGASAAVFKTRSFDAILDELCASFALHADMGGRLGGVHCELTGEHVTECTGGPENLAAVDLPLNYTTQCDPRLNHRQSIEMAFRLADELMHVRKCT